jgi:dGTPase
MGDEYIKIMEIDGKVRAIADYIAGMTDHYAITVYSNIYIPKAWKI